MITRSAWIGLLIGCMAAGGCDQGRQTPSRTTVHVVHAAPSFGPLTFLRVRSIAATLPYKNDAVMSFDEDRYDFNVEISPPGASEPENVLTFAHDVLAGTEYTFILTDIGGLLEPIILENPVFDRGAGDSQVIAVHAAPDVPPVDVYLEPPGTDISAASPVASLAFTQHIAPQTISGGVFELTVTGRNNPSNVLLTSGSLTLGAGEPFLLVIVDEGNQGIADFSVLLLGDTARTLYDRNLQAAMRVINTAADRATRDLYLDDDFSAPLFASVGFGDTSDYQTVPTVQSIVSVTPEGNVGVIELEQEVQAAHARRHTLLVTGEPGDLIAGFALDDGRGIAQQARVRLANGANQFEELHFFVIPPDTPPLSAPPAASLTPAAFSATIAFAPGDYEVLLHDGTDDGFIAGPLPITLDSGGVYGILAIDGDTSATAGIVLLDDFN